MQQLSDVFFDELEIPRLDYNLEVGYGNHGYQTGRMLEKIEELLLEIKSDCVLVYGYTNSTLAGALVAVKLSIPLAHVEAGLRSFNRKMPEEINRVLTDHSSDFLFAPTETAVSNLRREGIPENKIHLVGDVMYDAALFYAEKALKVKADVYHFHDPELIHIGVLLKLFTRKKVIYDVHEDYGKQILSKPYIPKSVRKVISSLIKALEYISSMFFDGIITATDDILRNFAYHKRAISIKNFSIIANFSNTTRIDNDNKNIFKLIYVGGLTEVRGIVQTVQALEFINSNKQVKLILCGKFNPPDLEIRVRNLKGFEKVEYLGWVDSERVPELLSKANVGIVVFLLAPNHIDAMPNKLFEYSAAGLPVIASNFPLWKEIVEGNGCGICVDPLKPEEIAKAAEYLIEHPDEARKMEENGRRAVLEKYNWEKESKKLLKLYEEVIG